MCCFCVAASAAEVTARRLRSLSLLTTTCAHTRLASAPFVSRFPFIVSSFACSILPRLRLSCPSIRRRDRASGSGGGEEAPLRVACRPTLLAILFFPPSAAPPPTRTRAKRPVKQKKNNQPLRSWVRRAPCDVVASHLSPPSHFPAPWLVFFFFSFGSCLRFVPSLLLCLRR